MKILFQFIILLYLFVACTKTEKVYNGKNIDNEILGKWNKQYSVRDQNNGITVYSDTILFNSDNSGIWMQYKFNKIYNSDPFSYYTEVDRLHIGFEKTGVHNIWDYSIENETLTIARSNFNR